MSEPTDPALDRADKLTADVIGNSPDDIVGLTPGAPRPLLRGDSTDGIAGTGWPESDVLAEDETVAVFADADGSVTEPADAAVSVIHPESDEVTFDFPKPFQKRVAIVGFAGGHAHLAPFDNPDIECWGINRLWKILPDKKFDRWFELHNLREFYENDPEHRAFLKAFEGPVYVRSQDYHLALEWGIETAQPYPDQVILDRFWPYFNNTISWLVALAILMNDFDRHEDGDGYEWMGLYGIDMAQDHVLQAEYCVSPETRVLTADLEWMPAGKLAESDELVGFDEYPGPAQRRLWRTTTVEHVAPIALPSYRICLEDGTELVSSSEHRWLVHSGKNRKWRATADLKPGQHVAKAFDPWMADQETWEAGWLAGIVDGDGFLAQRNRQNTIGFAQKAGLVAEHFERTLGAFGFEYSKTPHGGRGNETLSNYRILGGKAETLRFLGTMRPPRLLSQFRVDKLGEARSRPVRIRSVEYIGIADLVALKTGTGTFVGSGVLSHNSQQRPSCEYFVGLATGRGIEIYIPHGADLLKATHLYGYEDAGPVLEKMSSRFVELGQNKEQIRGQILQAQAQIGAMEGQLSQMDGAMQELGYWRKNWLNLNDTPDLPPAKGSPP